jgi:hypothetical protein
MGTNNYKKVNLWADTYKIFKARHEAVNKDLKSFGRKYNIPFTKFIHVIARDSRLTLGPEELRRIVRVKRK